MNLTNGAVVVDDHPRRREIVCSILAASGVPVLAAAASGHAAAEALVTHRPRVVFISFEEPYQRAASAVDFVTRSFPGTALIAYSSSEALNVFQLALRAGALTVMPAPFRASDVQQVLAAFVPASTTIPAPRTHGRIVAIVGQKGGIGKTTISVNLATALAREKKQSVLMVDFDTSFGDVALGLNVDPAMTTARLARSYRDMSRAEFTGELLLHESGAFVLPAPARLGEWLNVKARDLRDMVSFASEMFDFVLVDTPGAYNDAVAAGIEIADHSLIVSSLELTSAKNTALLLDALRSEGYAEERTLVVANHTTRDTGLASAQLATMLGGRSLWEIPFDPKMRQSTQNGTPITGQSPRAPASLSLRALAARLTVDPDHIERRRSMRDSRERSQAPRQRGFAFPFTRKKAS